MKYYITDCITGVYDEEEAILSREGALKVRDDMNAKRKAEGGSDSFWVVVDEDGNKVD